MRFLFLGTGTSAGIPMIGCHCNVCQSADPRDQRLRTSAALAIPGGDGIERIILFDAGPDLRTQALRAGLVRCDAIFFTHNHVDHIFGLDEVRRFNAVQGSPIAVYADDHTMHSLERVYQHIFDRANNVNDSFVASLLPHRLRIPDHSVPDAIGLWGVRVTPIRLHHGKLPILGYRIDAPGVGADSPFPLAYCTDVSGIPPTSWKQLTGLKTLVLDALRHRKHPTHFTLEEAVNVAAHVGATQTYFVHMAHEIAHAITQETLPEGMFLAWDGLELR